MASGMAPADWKRSQTDMNMIEKHYVFTVARSLDFCRIKAYDDDSEKKYLSPLN
jgi:hypothetical protein